MQEIHLSVSYEHVSVILNHKLCKSTCSHSLMCLFASCIVITLSTGAFILLKGILIINYKTSSYTLNINETINKQFL